MKMQNAWATALVAAAVLALPASAGAVVSSSQITTPASPAFDINDEDAGSLIAVAGTSDGTTGDEVDLVCYYGSTPSSALLAEEVPVAADGSFAEPDFKLANIDERVCRLRAVPAGTLPTDLAPFQGPLMATGERSSFRVSAGPNAGVISDYFIYGQQVTAANDFTTAGDCGLTDSYLFDSELEETTATFFCNDFFDARDDQIAPTRSAFQVDGANAYMGVALIVINEAASGYPATTYSYSQNPLNGDLTIEESDPIVKCVSEAFPANEGNCPAFASTGVRLDRTIVQSRDGHLVTIADDYVSSDGAAHALDMLNENEQFFGSSGADIGYRFPGEGGFATHADSAVVPFTAGPGAVFMQVGGAADGDTETGRGAIVFDRSASPATFDRVTLQRSGFNFHQTGTVPAGGSTRFRLAYAQAYTAAEVEALVKDAEAAFRPAAEPIAAPVAPSNAFQIKKLMQKRSNGTAKVQLDLAGPGKLVLTSQKVKRTTVDIAAAGLVAISVRPRSNLIKTLDAKGKVKISVKIAFTPTGGTAGTKNKKLTLVKSR